MDVDHRLLEHIASYMDTTEQNLVQRGLTLAAESHEGRFRINGDPYLQHAVAVADILATWKAPPSIVVTGLLHDVLKEKYAAKPSLELIEKLFGSKVVDLIQDTSELGRFGSSQLNNEIADLSVSLDRVTQRLPWVMSVMQRNPLAVVVKIADRLDNLLSLDALDSERRREFAVAAMSVFVPLADRLGMRAAKRELEDRSFSILQPTQYAKIAERRLLDQSQQAQSGIVEKVLRYLQKHGLRVEVMSAPASLYEIHRNEVERRKSLPLHLTRPLLIVAEDSSTCYQILGHIHELWRPEPSMFGDYIASPKLNGYRSLHTWVRYAPGELLTVMIRNRLMDLVAERGLTAQWFGASEDILPVLPAWNQPPAGKIFVFTPDGDTVILPTAATPIDFAYKVHRSLGNQCIGVVVNGHQCPLDQPLKTGDVVKILTSGSGVEPAADWLEIVKTAKARRSIRQALKSQKPNEASQRGWELLDRRLREQGLTLTSPHASNQLESAAKQMGYSSISDLLIAIGLGYKTPNTIILQMQYSPRRGQVSAAWRVVTTAVEAAHLPRRFARCCNPQPPDPIVSYVTKTNEVVIHRTGCGVVSQRRPLISTEWEIIPKQLIHEITVTALGRSGLVRDVSREIAGFGVNLSSFHADQIADGSALIQMGLGENIPPQIGRLLERLKSIDGVREVLIGAPQMPSRFAEHSAVAHRFDNPYTLYPVTDRQFYGRQNDLRNLVGNLRDLRPGQAVLLWGPRRIGKTSLLLEFQRTVLKSDSYMPIFVDIQAISGSTTATFLHEILKMISQNVRNPLVKLPNFRHLDRDPLGVFRSFIDTLFRYQEPQKQLVLLLDEFHLLTGLREERESLENIFNYLRSMVQHGGISFVFSGGGVLENLRRYGATPLLNVVKDQKVTNLERTDAQKLIVEPVERIQYAEDVVTRLLDMTMGHPYYVQMLCEELISRANQESRQRIEAAHLDELLTIWLPDQGEQYFSHLWGSDIGLEYNQQAHNKLTLVAVAALTDPDQRPWVDFDQIVTSKVGQLLGETDLWLALRSLVELDTLVFDRDNDSFRIDIDLFRRWMCANYTLERVAREMGR